MRKKFVRYYSNNVRGGRLLEIMDYMASSGAYRYCLPADSKNADFSVVTASVDHINFFRPVVVDRDCMFSAYATYAGTSSVEVQVNVLQRRGNEEVLSCTATFSMVARDKTLKAKHKVPPMQLKDEG
jgi:acyl-coenzyme A thioesterase 9